MTRDGPMSARRSPALDGLRGVAILLVLGHNVTPLNDATSLFGRVSVLTLDVGWIGVQLFFVLSGFLITRSLLDAQASPTYYRDFFVRRALRIFPLYYGVLLLCFVVLPALGALPQAFHEEEWQERWMWLFLYNWTLPYGSAHSQLPHFWSLSVEEQFYLLWPFVLHRRTPRQILCVCLSTALVALLIRLGMRLAHLDPEAVYSFSVCRMDAMALGGLAAAMTRLPHTWQKVLVGRRFLWPGAIGLFVGGMLITHSAYARTELLSQVVGYSVLAVVFMLVVLAAVAVDELGRGAWLRALPLRTFGKYSYGIYVIHKPLHDLLGAHYLAAHSLKPTTSPLVGWCYVVVFSFVTLMLAMAIYHLFEIRFLALKTRFGGAPQTAQ